MLRPPFRNVFRNLFRRSHVESDLDQEVRAFAAMLADEKTQTGMTRQEAERAARIELGGIEQVKEQVRASRTGAWIDTLAADLRYAFRVLRKNPGFAAVTVITLALGIGANAALFSAVNALLLGELPYKDADRLMYITEFWPHEPTVPGRPRRISRTGMQTRTWRIESRRTAAAARSISPAPESRSTSSERWSLPAFWR